MANLEGLKTTTKYLTVNRKKWTKTGDNML